MKFKIDILLNLLKRRKIKCGNKKSLVFISYFPFDTNYEIIFSDCSKLASLV